jgi:hypothetical protein
MDVGVIEKENWCRGETWWSVSLGKKVEWVTTGW